MNWFEAIVYACVIYILGITVANAVTGNGFNVLAISASLFMLLSLPILYKLATRRNKRN
jgi:hypothetical protein